MILSDEILNLSSHPVNPATGFFFFLRLICEKCCRLFDSNLALHCFSKKEVCTPRTQEFTELSNISASNTQLFSFLKQKFSGWMSMQLISRWNCAVKSYSCLNIVLINNTVISGVSRSFQLIFEVLMVVMVVWLVI